MEPDDYSAAAGETLERKVLEALTQCEGRNEAPLAAAVEISSLISAEMEFPSAVLGEAMVSLLSSDFGRPFLWKVLHRALACRLLSSLHVLCLLDPSLGVELPRRAYHIFEDHFLWHSDCNTNNIYITSDQDRIISYCKADSDDHWTEACAGSINISNILTGKFLAKINAGNGGPQVDECSSSSRKSKKQKNSQTTRITVGEALENITALFYDKERNEIYTGNRHGLVHVWSN